MENLAPPPTDPLVRKEPPFDWYRSPVVMPRRVETPERQPDLDPDIALWPVTPLQRWPFTGAPAEGIWPKGWAGVDNTGTMYVCTVGGQPGTWVAVGSGGGGGWPTVNGTGAGNLTAQTGPGDTVGYNLTDEGSGGISLTSSGTGEVVVNSAAGVSIQDDSASKVLLIQETGDSPLEVSVQGTGGITIQDFGGGGLILQEGGGAGSVTINEAGTGGITVETTGGGATTGIALTTQATDTGGIALTDHGTGGVKIQGVTYFAGSGSPVGAVTPKAEGDLYVDDTTPALWQATGVANTDWQQVGTSGQTMDWLSATSLSNQSLTQDAPTTITGFSVAASGGSSISLGVDDETFTLAAGVYSITLWVQLSGSVSTDYISLNPILVGTVDFPGGLNVMSRSQGSNGDNDIGQVGTSMETFAVADGTTMQVSVEPSHGSAPDTMGACDISIVRLGSLTPAA